MSPKKRTDDNEEAAAGAQQKRAAEAGGDGNKRIKPGTDGDLVPINGLPVRPAASRGGGGAAAANVAPPVPVIDKKGDADVVASMRSIVPYTIFLTREMLKSREEFKSQFADQDLWQHQPLEIN